jgi:hypothetical protein
MKRAKLRGLKRNAEEVLGNAGTADDVNVRRYPPRTSLRRRSTLSRAATLEAAASACMV